MARTIEGMSDPEVAGVVAAAAVAGGVTTKDAEFARAREEFGEFGLVMFRLAFFRGDRDLVLVPGPGGIFG